MNRLDGTVASNVATSPGPESKLPPTCDTLSRVGKKGKEIEEVGVEHSGESVGSGLGTPLEDYRPTLAEIVKRGLEPRWGFEMGDEGSGEEGAQGVL